MDVRISCGKCSEWIAGDSDERFLECACGQQYMISVTAVHGPRDADG